MEEEYHGGAALHHPLLHAAGRLHPSSAAALASYPTTHSQWDDDPPQQLLPLDYGGHDQQQQLREALLRALGELDASRAELRRVESERDEIRRHYHSLLLLLHHHHSSQPPPPGFELQGGCAAAMDELPQGIRTGTAASMSSEEGDYYAAEAEMALPEKGRLVEAVVAAGPLLQTLLLAGPLPRWRHPPPPAPADMVIPPFNPGAANANGNSSFSSASSSSPESGNCGGGPALPVVVALPLGQQQDALPCFRIMTTGSPFCM
ncbi:hypothetical protein BRADI_5g01120v3 [Brachypodium distachyon]|uniref:Uncharacterized protein n=1 Tax=Brachypodium distachyon TaxID=15368 RepID=I1IVL4_BRADI|nr:hypothetical protein BRADI_5g01120v3 [Brachypodium distachyon]